MRNARCPSPVIMVSFLFVLDDVSFVYLYRNWLSSDILAAKMAAFLPSYELFTCACKSRGIGQTIRLFLVKRELFRVSLLLSRRMRLLDDGDGKPSAGANWTGVFRENQCGSKG